MRGEFWTNIGTYEVSVSDSGVSSESEVGVALPSLMIGPPSVERGVPSGPGAGSIGSAGMGLFSVIGGDSTSSTIVELRSPVSGGTRRLEVECVVTGAWVSLALPIPRFCLTSSSNSLYNMEWSVPGNCDGQGGMEYHSRKLLCKDILQPFKNNGPNLCSPQDWHSTRVTYDMSLLPLPLLISNGHKNLLVMFPDCVVKFSIPQPTWVDQNGKIPPWFRNVEEVASVAWREVCTGWVFLEVYFYCTGDCDGGFTLPHYGCMDRWHVCVMDCTELALEDGGEDE